MKTWLTAAFMLSSLGWNYPANADSVKFLRYPHISNQGQIAFSYHGDIWIADGDGSQPRRLTAHVARDTFPRFSPDGKTIAFTSNRAGNNDVWTVPVAGGVPKQLTFHSTSDTGHYWAPDGNAILVSTTRGSGVWGNPLYLVPIDGSIPTPLDMDRGAAGMIRQDGSLVAFNRTGFRYWRKHYRGNSNTDIWVQDRATREIRQLTDTDMKQFRNHTQDAYPMWGADGMIYFMSERDDTFNLWKIHPDGGKPIQVTFHKTDGIQYPAISPDGRTVIYENEFELWKLELTEGARPEKISIDLSFDPKDNLVEYLDVNNSADGFSPSPDGSMVAVDYHGEIFMVPVDPESGEKTQVTASPWRDRYEVYSPDGKHIAYISDESGDEEVWLYNVETGKRRQLSHHPSVKRTMLWSPDSSKLFLTAANQILMLEVESGATTELAHNPEGGYRLVSLSAQGQWLVYTRSNADLNSDVYLFNIDERSEHNLTRHRFDESGGYLTPDGSHLVFASNRGGDYQVYSVSLTKLDQDPDDPLNRKKRKTKKPAKPAAKPKDPTPPEAGKPDDKQQEEKDESAADKASAAGPKPEALKMDLDNIDRRARRITSAPGGVSDFFLSKDGKTVYFMQSGGLYSVPVRGGNSRKVADGSFRGLTMTSDGKWFFFRQGSQIQRMSSKGGSAQPVRFQFRVKVDHRKEWEQVFEESWRVMKYRFYDEKMHGYDWDAIKARYKPLLKYVGENQDLYDLCNEMIGELNASHTGVSGPPTRSMPRQVSTRQLGFEMKRDGRYFRVSHIYRNGPADKEWLDLNVGDFVLEIEDQPIRDGVNYLPILNHLLNSYVDLKVASPGKAENDDTQILGKPRSLRIRATGSLRNLKYESWVEANRKYVDELSGGKVGYVHIRSMNRSSLRRFETEINQFWNKNGMIIDIRYNGGGNIDQELIDILERRPYEYWNHRWGGRARGRRPRQAIAGPKVMLINWRSASDSEVTPQAFRDLKLGRIVGNPTYGAVIATGGYSLMNGGQIRTPGSLVVTYDPTQPNNYGTNLENFGVPPDVWVENTPEDELKGFDRELKTAVEEALKMLKEGTWQYGEDDPK